MAEYAFRGTSQAAQHRGFCSPNILPSASFLLALILLKKGNSGNESVRFPWSVFGGLLISAKSEIREENPLSCAWAQQTRSPLETGMFEEF